MLIDTITELCFPTPRVCPICLVRQKKLQICSSCLKMIERKKLAQGQCQRCHSFGTKALVCDNCRNWPKYVHQSFSCWPYSDEFRDLILRFKYQREPWLAKVLAQEMIKEIGFADIDLILPVPLHSFRLRGRGYNQSELLAMEIARITGVKYRQNVLVRIQNSAHQTGLSRERRMKNLQGAFFVKNPKVIEGKRILVVDDVLTTGATLLQCGRSLKEKGANEIIGLTLASGQR